jgi:hypothetical protein
MAIASPFHTVNLHPGAHLVQEPSTESKFGGGAVVFEDPYPGETVHRDEYGLPICRFADVPADKVLEFLWNAKEWDVDARIVSFSADDVHGTVTTGSAAMTGKYLDGYCVFHQDYVATPDPGHWADPVLSLYGASANVQPNGRIAGEVFVSVDDTDPPVLPPYSTGRQYQPSTLPSFSGRVMFPSTGDFSDVSKTLEIRDADAAVVGELNASVTCARGGSYTSYINFSFSFHAIYIKPGGGVDIFVTPSLQAFIYGYIGLVDSVGTVETGTLNMTFLGVELSGGIPTYATRVYEEQADFQSLDMTVSYDIDITEKWEYPA